MTLEQLWTMTKSEFDKLNKRVDVLEDKVKVIDDMKKKVDLIDDMKKKVDLIDDMKKKVDLIDDMKKKVDQIDGIKNKVDQIDEKFDKKFDEINSKLNIMSNINIPKILEYQVETRKELNEKIDKLILQNNLEHKQFAYQIAKLEMNEGFTKIG